MGKYEELIRDIEKGKDLESNVTKLYQLVLDGEVKSFPHRFWVKEHSEVYIGICTRYLIHNILGHEDYSKKDVITEEDYARISKVTYKDFIKNKLSRIYLLIPDCFPVRFIEIAYPNKFNLAKVREIPATHWNEERANSTMYWLIQKYNLEEDTLNETLTKEMFYENNLKTLYDNYFKRSLYNAVNSILPNKFKPWEFNRVPRGYWNLETSKEATRWLVEEVLGLDGDTAFDTLRIRDFKDNNLGGMLASKFKESVFLALKNAYGND